MNKIRTEMEEIFFSDAMDKKDKLNFLINSLKEDKDNQFIVDETLICLKKLKRNSKDMGYTFITFLADSLEFAFKNSSILFSAESLQVLHEAKNLLSEAIINIKFSTSKKNFASLINSMRRKILVLSTEIHYKYAS